MQVRYQYIFQRGCESKNIAEMKKMFFINHNRCICEIFLCHRKGTDLRAEAVHRLDILGALNHVRFGKFGAYLGFPMMLVISTFHLCVTK